MNVDELFAEVYPQLQRCCTPLTADAELAEDAAQEPSSGFSIEESGAS